ncbi:MAG: GTP cyclohydrolase MptA [Methanomassiliicoccaceae archaeon]|jgi:GTP cyclohydrolase-4|nr:GTP cyclohydrolase MptA [Methanomassiliicoccaceae archaeon]
MNKCDVQSRRLDTGFKLTRVGVRGVKKPVRIKRDEKAALINDVLNCTIDVFVDLPAEQKGSHLSRNLEVLGEIVDESVSSPVSGIETLAANICRKLLNRHDYADTAEAVIIAEYFRNNKTPNGRDTLELYTLIGEASAVRNKGLSKTLGVEVIGMTACPCAQETVGSALNCKTDVAVMSHNQRNICTVSITLDENEDIEANDLIDIVEASFSSPTYEILKRDDEAAVVINAHNNPKFVEDVVRDVLRRIVERYTELPDDVHLIVRSESEESIHKHNAFAERQTLLGELRNR